MDQEITTLTVKGHADTIRFHLKMPTVAEDTSYTQRFAQIADKKGEAKANAEYAIYSDTLAAWSAKHPERVTESDGEETVTALEGETPEEAAKSYFDSRSASKEWMAVTAVSAFRNSLFPTVVFHEHSA